MAKHPVERKNRVLLSFKDSDHESPERKERKNRVLLSFKDSDHESLTREAQEARLPIATYARLLILNRPKLRAAPAIAVRRVSRPRSSASR